MVKLKTDEMDGGAQESFMVKNCVFLLNLKNKSNNFSSSFDRSFHWVSAIIRTLPPAKYSVVDQVHGDVFRYGKIYMIRKCC